MSSCSVNPAVVYGAYNPGEVRLYGRPTDTKQFFSLKDDQVLSLVRNQLETLDLSHKDLDKLVKIISGIIAKIIEMILKMLSQNVTVFVFDGKEFHYVSIDVGNEPKSIKDIGIIYGYAYEGHCYKLPKPQIMLLPSTSNDILQGDCGCDCGYAPELGYKVWIVDKLKRVISLDVRSDDLKTLVLEENTPGKRSPMAYAQVMSLSPQRSME